MGFKDQVAAWVAKTKAQEDEVIRLSLTSLASAIIFRSPVDTGLFRGSWVLEVSKAASEASLDDLTPKNNLDKLDKEGNSTLAGIKASIPKDAAGQVYYLRNATPYGPLLEAGSSQQAPQGIVALSVIEFNTFLAQAVQQVRST